MIWFFLSLTAFICIFASSLILEKIEFFFYWNKGLIPPWRGDKENTRIYIYIALAGLLLGNRKIDAHPKLENFYRFILKNRSGRLPMAERNSYFNKLKNMLAHAREHPIKLEAAGEWFRRNHFSMQKKVQLIRALADFAYIDGKIHPREMAIIAQLCGYFSITESQLEEIVEKLKHQEKEESEHRQNSTGIQQSEYVKCCAILGVSRETNLKDIKKAYRKLAHACHPDRFENASKTEYEAAQKRFIEIQRAYETLEKMIAKKP